jgi:hypothetical protein
VKFPLYTDEGWFGSSDGIFTMPRAAMMLYEEAR